MQTYIRYESASFFLRLRLLGYYVQRLCTSRRIRHLATRILVTLLRVRFGPTMHKHACGTSIVDTLRMQGAVRLGSLLYPDQCADMLAYLHQQNMVAVRGTGASFTLNAVPDGTRMADYPLETVVNCPHVMELANHPDLLAIATRYLGYTPTITLLSMRWSFPSKTADNDVQSFHRDSEPGSIKLLVYLTDVDYDSGPHRYAAGSHRDRMPLRLHNYSDAEVSQRHGGSLAFIGPAGTGIVIDSKGIHKGNPPVSGARLLLGIQYSLLPCLIYQYRPVNYRGPVRFSRYVNRLMVNAAPACEALSTQLEPAEPLTE